MGRQLEVAKSYDFANDWAKNWIEVNVRHGSHHSARDSIKEMVNDHFKHLKYALAVYPETYGYNNHITNFDGCSCVQTLWE